MERHGYRTVKELHNGEFFVHDYIFVSSRLYNSVRRGRWRLRVADDEDQQQQLHGARPLARRVIGRRPAGVLDNTQFPRTDN